MNLEGIQKIEVELQIKLPESYKNIILNNPYGDKTKFDIVCEHFYDDPDDLIKINKRLRKQGLQKKEWLDNLFAIAYCDGEYTFVRIDDEKERVYIANRGSRKYEPAELEENHFSDTYREYLSTFIHFQQMKAIKQKRELNGEKEPKIDVNEYLNMWDAMIRTNNQNS